MVQSSCTTPSIGGPPLRGRVNLPCFPDHDAPEVLDIASSATPKKTDNTAHRTLGLIPPGIRLSGAFIVHYLEPLEALSSGEGLTSGGSPTLKHPYLTMKHH